MPGAAYLADHDESDALWKCEKVGDFTAERAGYFLVKAFEWIESLPFP